MSVCIERRLLRCGLHMLRRTSYKGSNVRFRTKKAGTLCLACPGHRARPAFPRHCLAHGAVFNGPCEEHVRHTVPERWLKSGRAGQQRGPRALSPKMQVRGWAWVPGSERPHRIERVPWSTRMEGAQQQKRRADHVQPREQDLADELLRAVHATAPDLRKTGCYRAGLFSLVKPARKLLRLSRVTPARLERSS